ncbi:hypothetical protein C8J57DRAFT_1229227 [Mycena rebaudengoi]|nr:hypothetical protein C8J57DRAFT_1229227 [Mycena rebaudengoi]
MDEHTATNLTVPLVSPTHSLRIARLMTTFVDCLGKMLNAPSVTAIAVDEQEFISETDFKGSCSAFSVEATEVNHNPIRSTLEENDRIITQRSGKNTYLFAHSAVDLAPQAPMYGAALGTAGSPSHSFVFFPSRSFISDLNRGKNELDGPFLKKVWLTSRLAVPRGSRLALVQYIVRQPRVQTTRAMNVEKISLAHARRPTIEDISDEREVHWITGERRLVTSLGRALVEAKFCDIIEGSPRKWDENTAKSAKNMAWTSSSEEWGAGWPLCIEGAVLAWLVLDEAKVWTRSEFPAGVNSKSVQR